MEETQRARGRQTWIDFLDNYRYIVIGILFLIFFLYYGALVWLSGTRNLTPAEQTALALVGVVISAVFGGILAAPLTRRRIRIASQLRRAYGLCQILRNGQRDVRDRMDRMNSLLEQESLAPAAPLVNEFFYGLLATYRTILYEAERIVEDWGEMDPAERERIRLEEAEKTKNIEGLYRELALAKTVARDLTTKNVGSDIVLDLQRRIRELEEAYPGQSTESIVGVRALLGRGQYHDAVVEYTKMIEVNPNSYTHYIGRARARYLAGDEEGALRDLDRAENLRPDDPTIEDLRDDILYNRSVSTPDSSTARGETFAGNQALTIGDVEGAIEHYKLAGSLGWNIYFTTFNLAMAEFCRGNLRECRRHLSALSSDSESYMYVNSEALGLLCDLVDGLDASDAIGIMQNATAGIDHFDFSRSPLRYLELGLLNVDSEQYETTRPIFDFLKGAQHGRQSGKKADNEV